MLHSSSVVRRPSGNANRIYDWLHLGASLCSLLVRRYGGGDVGARAARNKPRQTERDCLYIHNYYRPDVNGNVHGFMGRLALSRGAIWAPVVWPSMR